MEHFECFYKYIFIEICEILNIDFNIKKKNIKQGLKSFLTNNIRDFFINRTIFIFIFFLLSRPEGVFFLWVMLICALGQELRS